MATIYAENGETEKTVINEPAKTSLPSRPKITTLNGLKKHFSVQVTTAHGDVILLICCIISGLVDSTIYNAYGTFVSMQTVRSIHILHLYPICALVIVSRPDHGFLLCVLGQYNLPRSRWRHSPPHLETLRLGEILFIHCILLSRLLLLQPHLSSSITPPPVDAHRIFPPSITDHLGDRCDNTSRSRERKLDDDNWRHQLETTLTDSASVFPKCGPDCGQSCARVRGGANSGLDEYAA